MSRRQAVRVAVEVSFTMPPGMPPGKAVALIRSLLEDAQAGTAPKLPALSLRLLRKETTYLT